MGWTYTDTPANEAEFIRNLFTFEDFYCGNVRNSEVVYMTKRGNVYYLAVHMHKWGKFPEIAESYTYAAIVITERHNGEFLYKAMNEDEDPFHCDAPKKLLAMLTPTDSEYAQNWRKRCADRTEENRRIRRNLKLLKSLKPTDHIDTEFSGKLYHFYPETYLGKSVMVCCDGYVPMARFPKIFMTDHHYTIVREKEE